MSPARHWVESRHRGRREHNYNTLPDHGASSILQTVVSPAQPWVESRHRGHLCCRPGCDSGRPQHFARHWGKQRCLAATDEASLLRSKLSLCTGPARGHTVTHAVRLHLTPDRDTTATRLGAAMVPHGASAICTGPARGHTVLIKLRRCVCTYLPPVRRHIAALAPLGVTPVRIPYR